MAEQLDTNPHTDHQLPIDVIAHDVFETIPDELLLKLGTPPEDGPWNGFWLTQPTLIADAEGGGTDVFGSLTVIINGVKATKRRIGIEVPFGHQRRLVALIGDSGGATWCVNDPTTDFHFSRVHVFYTSGDVWSVVFQNEHTTDTRKIQVGIVFRKP